MGIILRYKYPLALVFAGACLVGAVFLTKLYFEERERQLRAQIRQESRLTDIVVAQYDLAPGSRVDLDTMTIKSIPFEYVPDGAVTPDQYASFEFKFLSDPISAGKPLLRHFVEGVSRVEKFSDVLTAGERAITLEVDGVSSVEHMIEAGDFIDLGVRDKKNNEFNLLLERTKVLSTGNFTISDPKQPEMYKGAQYTTITLGVDSRYIQDIYEADNNGELVYLLRNEKDDRIPLYELAPGAHQEVVVYSAGETEEGVLKAATERVSLNTGSQWADKNIRNEKGKLIRIARDQSPKVNKEVEAVNDALTSAR